MATVSKAIIDSTLRNKTFDLLGISQNEHFQKVNDQTYGTIITDENGIQRYVRVKVVIAEVREDMTAEEYQASEQEAYTEKMEKREAVKRERAEKAQHDKKAREAKKKKEEDDE